MKKRKTPEGSGQVLDSIAQKLFNWAFIVSAGIVLWLLNSFDKFTIDGKLPFKWVYVGAVILFFLSMMCVTCFKLSFLFQN